MIKAQVTFVFLKRGDTRHKLQLFLVYGVANKIARNLSKACLPRDNTDAVMSM